MANQRATKAERRHNRLMEQASDGHRRRFGRGTSKAADKRRGMRTRGKLYSGKAGDVIQMSDRCYTVTPDGSFRRLRPAA